MLSSADITVTDFEICCIQRYCTCKTPEGTVLQQRILSSVDSKKLIPENAIFSRQHPSRFF